MRKKDEQIKEDSKSNELNDKKEFGLFQENQDVEDAMTKNLSDSKCMQVAFDSVVNQELLPNLRDKKAAKLAFSVVQRNTELDHSLANMLYVGIDPSMNSTGLVILNYDMSIQIQKTISSNSKDSDELRIKKIGEEIISEILKLNRQSKVCIEGISFGSSGRGVAQQAGLNYFICILLNKYDIPYVKCPPTTLKKFVTGKGQCKKELMMLKTYKKWGIEFENSDICDAYGLARYCKEN